MSRLHRLGSLSLPLALLLGGNLCFAGSYNHRDLIPGGKSAFLGGAYAAIAKDPSGLYFNPAGVGFSHKGELSLNTTAFYSKKTKYKAAINSKDFNETSTASFPISIGSLYSRENLSFGYLILSKDFQDALQSDYFSDITEEDNFANVYSRFQQESRSYQLYGLGMALKLGPSVSLGFSHFFYHRTRKLTIHQHAGFINQNIINLDQSVLSQSSGSHWVYGLLCQWKALSIGISGSYIVEAVDSTSLSQDSLQITGNSESPPANVHTETENLSGEDNLFPNTYRLGLMLRPSSYLKLASDLVFHEGVSHQGNTSGLWDLNPVLNYSMGVELSFGQMSLMSGVFSNHSAATKIERTAASQPDHINFTGYSIALGYGLKSFGTSIGWVVQDGIGEAKKVTGLANVQELSSQSQTAFLSMHYYL